MFETTNQLFLILIATGDRDKVASHSDVNVGLVSPHEYYSDTSHKPNTSAS